jgi:acetoin utilization protein AcuB
MISGDVEARRAAERGMSIETVQRHMTVSPVVIGSDRTLDEAHRLMRERGIRHLPVVDGGALVGLVSQRDLYLAETLKGVDPGTDTVREAMSAEPYAVRPDASLAEVAEVMAERKLGSAVVVDRGSVIGLFTTVDALHSLARLAARRRR